MEQVLVVLLIFLVACGAGAIRGSLRKGPVTHSAIEPFALTSIKKSWGEEVLIAHVPGKYAGKLLFRTPEGERAGLQFHQSRDETFFLYEGRAIVYWVDADGVLRKRAMAQGDAFHVPPGAIHSVQTVGPSIMFETSNGAYPDAVRVEDEYDISTAVES